MQHLVSYSLHEGVATLLMDDGKVNVMSPTMQQQIHQALDRAQTDNAAVVIAGRPGVLSAGFDLPLLRADTAQSHEMLKGGFELALRLLSFPTPTVVACTGHALAMGAFLVCACDYRLVAAGPFKIAANEVAIGMTMPHFALELCKLRLTPAYFHRAMLLAEIFSPESAQLAGFVDEVVSGEQLLEAATEKARQLTKLHLPSHASTKLRARADLLPKLRAAIGLDDKNFREGASHR